MLTVYRLDIGKYKVRVCEFEDVSNNLELLSRMHHSSIEKIKELVNGKTNVSCIQILNGDNNKLLPLLVYEPLESSVKFALTYVLDRLAFKKEYGVLDTTTDVFDSPAVEVTRKIADHIID